MDTTAVKRCRRPTSVGLNVKWAEITHAQVCVIALFTIDLKKEKRKKRLYHRNGEVLMFSSMYTVVIGT